MSIKVIQVGVGGFGTSWRRALSTIPKVEVVALADVSQNALDDAQKFFNMPKDRCFLDFNEALTNIDADVVLDATPQLHHYTNAMKAFANDKHLIVVKPMSNEWDTGVAMVRESQARGRKMVVAQQLRFHPIIMKIREIIQSGMLGQIGYIHQDAFFGKDGYSGSYPQPYPLLVQGAIHFFDYLRWVLDQEPLSVWADCWDPSWTKGFGSHCAYVTFVMSGKCHVCFRSIATDADHSNWTCDWRIEGDKGILKVINDHIYLNEEEISVAWEDGSDISDLGLPLLNKIVFENFIDYLERDEEPGFSGRNNLKSLEMAFGAIKSSQTGQKYNIEE
jgi:predicted dehydrogenase